MTNGRVTIPSESNFYNETKHIMQSWGADAIRNSDGTELDPKLKALGAKLYSTYFVSRGHNELPKEHPEAVQQLYLSSAFTDAKRSELTIRLLETFFDQQVQPDFRDDPKVYWEVMNRTTGELVPVHDWTVDEQTQSVTINNCTPWQTYSVSFLADMIWDPTEMYNHLTNEWGDKPHDIPFDVRKPVAKAYVEGFLKQWIAENPDVDVVRFTTFFYHFTLFFDQHHQEKFVDWFGYGGTVSVDALKAFEAAKGYHLRPEVFIDEGYYNSTFRVPSKTYLEYMDFIQRFVADEAKKLVDLTHAAGKEAMMFLGDNWIGTEPYGPYFKDIGLDAVVGSVGNGTTLRLISEIPHVRYTEGRFLPYFFPDVFKAGNDPTIEARENWLTARRAMMRKPVDRIGYGGYLSLATKFPKFVDYIQHVTNEFRTIYDTINGHQPYCGVTVGILNVWGPLRSWSSHMVAHAMWYKQIYSYLGVLESLSGQKVNVQFLSFDQLIQAGVPAEIDVLINAGDAGTAYSGGRYWSNPALLTTIKAWVAQGGGFVGIGQPTALTQNGRTFQLADVLGVDQEVGFSLSTDKHFTQVTKAHFITDEIETFDFGESMHNIYATDGQTAILEYSNNEIHLSAHDFHQGRGIYLAGLPYSPTNAMLLLKAIYYAAHKEDTFWYWQSSNPAVEVDAYPTANCYAILNNTNEPQSATIFDGEGHYETVTLNAGTIEWRDML